MLLIAAICREENFKFCLPGPAPESAQAAGSQRQVLIMASPADPGLLTRTHDHPPSYLQAPLEVIKFLSLVLPPPRPRARRRESESAGDCDSDNIPIMILNSRAESGYPAACQ
jgi:hypothetical protein